MNTDAIFNFFILSSKNCKQYFVYCLKPVHSDKKERTISISQLLISRGIIMQLAKIFWTIQLKSNYTIFSVYLYSWHSKHGISFDKSLAGEDFISHQDLLKTGPFQPIASINIQPKDIECLCLPIKKTLTTFKPHLHISIFM